MMHAHRHATIFRMAKSAAPHFQPEALKFLRALARNNRREWFQPRKAVFEETLKAPMHTVINAINDAMLDFAPENIQAPQKCMMRIYRDTRFSADKTPYKKHIAAWWARDGLEKTSGGGFYFHLSAKELVIAAGVYMPEREQLLAIRTYLLDHYEEMHRIMQNRTLRRLMTEFSGQRLTRPPKGFPKDHPAMDLLLCRQWGVEATLPAETALKPTLLREILTRFRAAAPMVELLNRPLITRLAARKRPLF
ncbi:MAG TPA: DUF2461 domain-containing protein [Acidobacteriaceae bacterium]|nr:DUF2461 domain-containing protein [Acidobacteriaceae bacterium]